MGESTHESTKKQKVFAETVCEDCGRKWRIILSEVPVTIFIKDVDDYYRKLSNNLLEAVDPPMVLCVFHPSDRELWDTSITLSCVAPHQASPCRWRINHKQSGPAAVSGCQIILERDKNVENKSEARRLEQDMVTIKEEIEQEIDDEIIEERVFDPLAHDQNTEDNFNSSTVYIKAVAPMVCPVCGKSVSGINGKQKLKYHILTHTGEKPHACPYCPHRSRLKFNLDKHVRSVHKDLISQQDQPQSQRNSCVGGSSCMNLTQQRHLNSEQIEHSVQSEQSQVSIVFQNLETLPRQEFEIT